MRARAATAGKYDMAQEFLKKAINHDKSCTKAWEYMGLIMEKESSYKDAADNYEQVRALALRVHPGWSCVVQR